MRATQAGLPGYLAAAKDYFLLAKGEFAHAFLGDARRYELCLAGCLPYCQIDKKVGMPFFTVAGLMQIV
jgi:hypothetical protein